MSGGPIKPVDIPQDLIESAGDEIGLHAGAWDMVDHKELCSVILNKSIENGIVSLPFPFARDDTGHVVRTAGPITLDDVSAELGEYANQTCVWYDGPQVDVVSVLNKAIEMGVVSPPCHYIEQGSGWRPRIAGRLRIWPGKPEPGLPQYRHWRGEE